MSKINVLMDKIQEGVYNLCEEAANEDDSNENVTFSRRERLKEFFINDYFNYKECCALSVFLVYFYGIAGLDDEADVISKLKFSEYKDRLPEWAFFAVKATKDQLKESWQKLHPQDKENNNPLSRVVSILAERKLPRMLWRGRSAESL